MTISLRKGDQICIAIVNKMEKTAIILDVAIPGDKGITDKEKDKVQKYQNLKREIQ